MRGDAIDALLDLLEFCEEIVLFAAGKDSGDDDLERMRYLAIERLFELVGESLNRAIKVEPEIEKMFPDTRQVIGMRNRIAHEYDTVDEETIWDTAFNDIPGVIREVQEILDVTRES